MRNSPRCPPENSARAASASVSSCANLPELYQHGASRGKRNVRAAAVEELNAKLLLQSFDLQGDGRLGQTKLLRRPAEVQVPGYRPKNFEPEIFHTRNLTRVAGPCLPGF